ncbi:LOW QUALITY PROTEIN: hypothetical protein V1477_006291 [Vespula maculifrons]|uniref:Uncharacterized protein n=1 Tax=Vespula maculifrons TaxID=7453 RepID=A0ABD2CK07_VESMC
MGSARRALSNNPGPVLVRALVSEKKILKEKCFFPLSHLNCYNSAPVGPIWTKKIWAALSNDPSRVLLGAIVSEKKILKEKCFFPLFPLNRYNSAPIGPICTQEIWASRARRALSIDPGPVLGGAIVSGKKITARQALSKDAGPVLLGAIDSDKKIVKEKCFFPLFPLKYYKSAPIGPICTQKIWAKIFFPLFHLNRYNSAPIGPICTQKIRALWARQALSNDPGPVLVRALVSEKKIVKEKCFFPLFPLNCYNSAPIGPIWTRKIWAALRELTNDLGRVLVRALVSEKKIVKEKCFFPLFPLNCYNSAPIGPIWTRKIWADPGPVLIGAIVLEKKIVKEKCFFPWFPLNRYNSAPIGPIWK